MLTFPFGESVVLHGRTVSGQDADGNDLFTDVPVSLSQVPVWPRQSYETVQGQANVVDGLTALLPVGTDPEAIDTVTVYGAVYAVDGEPGRFLSPFTGANPGVLVNLTRVTG